MAQTISFTVLGTPQQCGSKNAYVPLHRTTKEPFRRPGGGIMVQTTDQNKKAKPWMELVRRTAMVEYRGPMLTGFVGVSITFYFTRPKAHYGSGRKSRFILHEDAPEFPTTKDIDKLARAIHDALSGVIYVDDKFIADAQQRKRWGEPERVEIEITELATAGRE